MAWNLVDEVASGAAALAVVAPRLHIFVPLASIPIGQNNVRPIDRTKYSFTESYATLPAPDGRTSDVSLNISIEIPPGGLSDENGNPDPLIRLHALDEARVYFEPAGAGMQDRLVIEMLTFVFLRTPLIRGVPMWFRRWEDARSIPMTLIYENVDRAHLQNLLNAVAAPVDASLANRVKPTNGLQFPAEVIQANKANFIAQFLAGAADHFIFAESGSVVGTAATDP